MSWSVGNELIRHPANHKQRLRATDNVLETRTVIAYNHNDRDHFGAIPTALLVNSDTYIPGRI